MASLSATPDRRGRAARPRARELLACSALLAVLAAAVFGSHVASGGFYSDDWANAGMYRFDEQAGLRGAVEHAMSLRFFDYRPVLAVAIAVSHELFGLDPGPHLAMAAALGVLVSLSFFLFLRELGLPSLHAGLISALALVFPFSDSTRLWPTASLNNVAVALCLAGAVVALRGTQAHGRRGVLAHAAAVALYALSVLTYEVTAVPVLLLGALYWRRAGRRAALPRIAADVAAVGGALLVVAANTTRQVQPLDTSIEHALTIAEQTLTVIARAAVPFGRPPPAIVIAALGLVTIAAVMRLRRRRSHDAATPELPRWLTAAAMAAGGVVAGYAMLVPAHPHYSPLNPGLTNRMSLVAGLAIVTLVYALAMLAVGLLPLRRLAGRLPEGAPAVAVAAALGAGYVGMLSDDKTQWERSARLQAEVLAAIEEGVSRPPPGATLYAFGQPIYAAPGVPVFRHLDLNGAARVRLGTAAVEAYPMYPGVSFVCGPRALYPTGRGYVRPGADTGGRFSVEAASPYGRAIFIDVARRRAVSIGDRSRCLRERERFRPGRWVAAAAS